MKLLKNNKKLILGIIVGLVISIVTGVAAYTLYADSIAYNNTTSGLTSTNLAGAIDELYTKCTKDEKLIYRWTTTTWTTNQNITALANPEYVTRSTEVTNMNAKAEKYYLKYLVDDNVVVDKYTCFVISAAMQTANPGVNAGEYCLQGGDSGVAYTKNKILLETVFDNSLCTDNTTDYSCSVAGLTYYADNTGYVYVNETNGYCGVGNDGHSDCNSQQS